MRGGISSLSEIQRANLKTKQIAMTRTVKMPLPTIPKSKSMHGMSLNDVKRMMSREYTTSKELLDLSNLLSSYLLENKENVMILKKIKEGNKIRVRYQGKPLSINPNKPPSFITYDMLLNENLEEDNRKDKEEPDEKRKKELRIKWWGVWYKIITGFYSFDNTQTRQNGGGIDFEKAKIVLIKKIKATIALNKKINKTTGITKDEILKLAEDSLKMRNVKTVKNVRKNPRKTMSYKQRMFYDVKLEYINKLVNDVDVINALYSPDDAMETDKGTLRQPFKEAQPRRRKQLKETLAYQEEYRQALLQAHRPTPEEIKAQIQEAQIAQQEAKAQLEASRLQAQLEAQAQIKAELEAQAQLEASRLQAELEALAQKAKTPTRTPTRQAVPTDEEMDVILENIKTDVLKNADNHLKLYDETVLDRFNESFSNASNAMYKIKDAYKKKIKVDRLRDYTNEPRTITYPDENGYTRLYKTTHTLYMWAMQLPHQFDRVALLQSMLYLIEVKRIYAIVDLQDCVNTNLYHPDLERGIGCNPYDISSSEEVYNMVMSAIVPHKPKRYHRVVNYFDMSPGLPSAWDKISKIENTTKEENSVVIHCLGGKGRSGSVLLFLFLRDNIVEADVKERLGRPHFGFADINDFIYNMMQLLFNEAAHPLNPQTDSSIEDKMDASSEIFKIAREKVSGGITASRLLRQRINRILFYLAKDKKVDTYYNYGFPSKGKTYNDEFDYPVERTVDWSEYERGLDASKEWDYFS